MPGLTSALSGSKENWFGTFTRSGLSSVRSTEMPLSHAPRSSAMRLFSIELDHMFALPPVPTVAQPAPHSNVASSRPGRITLADPSAGDQLVHDRDHGNDQKNVEQATGGERGHDTEQPEDEKNDGNGVEHDRSPVGVANAGCVRA